MQAQPALWHDYETNGFPEWAPKALRGDILFIGRQRPFNQNSHETLAPRGDLPPAPPNKRARAALCYMMAREEVEPYWYPQQENMVITDVLHG
eukprot:12910721-Prorocentrum_lima.AAC.1